jgi:hypothetical protein
MNNDQTVGKRLIDFYEHEIDFYQDRIEFYQKMIESMEAENKELLEQLRSRKERSAAVVMLLLFLIAI